MLILNLKTTKHSQYILLSAYHLIPVTLNDFVHVKKFGNYQQTSYVMTKNNGKSQNKDNIDTWILCLYSLNT